MKKNRVWKSLEKRVEDISNNIEEVYKVNIKE